MRWILLLAVMACGTAFLAGAEEISSLPFGVTIAGQAAVAENAKAAFARIKDPVAADAELAVDVKAAPGKMIIINVFAADDKGNAKEGTVPAILLITGDNKTKLNKTMDNKALAAGTYCMNVVSGESTARVVFTVK